MTISHIKTIVKLVDATLEKQEAIIFPREVDADGAISAMLTARAASVAAQHQTAPCRLFQSPLNGSTLLLFPDGLKEPSLEKGGQDVQCTLKLLTGLSP